MTLLLAGTVYTPIRCLENALIEIVDGKIRSIEAATRGIRPTHDFSDAIVVPGLVDLQVNGAMGFSFQAHHREHWNEILSFHQEAGTTTLLPTLITAPEEVLLESLAVLSQACGSTDLGIPFLPGIHLEGPFLSPEKSGAHDPTSLRLPDLALARHFCQAARGKLRILTLAPELPGAVQVVSEMASLGVVVSAGHSAATYEAVQQAVQAGLRLVTHAGNASDWPHRALGKLGFLASEPGLVGTLMAEDRLVGGIILDGFHFHPALLPPLLKIKGIDRLVLVSDASTVAGCPPGEYTSGGLVVHIQPEGFAVSGRGGGWLAGSIITLLQAVQRAVQLAQIPLQQAVHMATLSPARVIGIQQHKGHLEPGADADLLILDQELRLRTVIRAGEFYSDRGR